MNQKRWFITIYCDEPSHTTDPIGPCVIPDANAGRPSLSAAAGLTQIDVARQEGVYIVGAFWKFDGSRLWAPHMRNVTGLSKRSGGRQEDQGRSNRYRLKCDLCALTRTQIEPKLSDTLTRLADRGMAAVSLRFLIKAIER